MESGFIVGAITKGKGSKASFIGGIIILVAVALGYMASDSFEGTLHDDLASANTQAILGNLMSVISPQGMILGVLKEVASGIAHGTGLYLKMIAAGIGIAAFMVPWAMGKRKTAPPEIGKVAREGGEKPSS